MYHKDIDLSSKKIDWLLLHRRDELRKIMHDNGKPIKLNSVSFFLMIAACRRLHYVSTYRFW